ncbi:FUSC family protein [Flavobacterium sp. W1B]|uniref:FUSC family protein n=1 Tax=Flavobacterium sp. W1B TaxID=3394146 RepID=UPI0039BD1762
MINKVIKYCIGSDLIIYVIRCIIGFLIGYQLYLQLPEYELYWTLLSIILVISPEAKDSKRLAIERFKSNLIGSGIGLFCFFIHAPNVYIILIGILLSISVCYYFKLMNVARTAIVALLIVLIHEQQQLTWLTAVERFMSVALGCFIGLTVTVTTSFIINYLRKKANLPQEESINLKK